MLSIEIRISSIDFQRALQFDFFLLWLLSVLSLRVDWFGKVAVVGPFKGNIKVCFLGIGVPGIEWRDNNNWSIDGCLLSDLF